MKVLEALQPDGNLRHTTALGETGAALPDLASVSERPRFIAVGHNSSSPMQLAVGDVNVDATTDAQFMLPSGGPPVIINCAGHTHFSVIAADIAILLVTPLANQ